MYSKTLIGTIALSILAPCLDAQRQLPSQEELISRRQHKLSEPWLKNAKWTLSLAEAREQAKKQGKIIFAYFTRSYSP